MAFATSLRWLSEMTKYVLWPELCFKYNDFRLPVFRRLSSRHRDLWQRPRLVPNAVRVKNRFAQKNANSSIADFNNPLYGPIEPICSLGYPRSCCCLSANCATCVWFSTLVGRPILSRRV